jgi:Coenzyme PQQ synthesis protein D (PqqD)
VRRSEGGGATLEFLSKSNDSVPAADLRPIENLSSSVDRERRYIRNTAIVSRDVAGELMVVPICRGVGDLDSIYTFNSLGRSLWLLLEKSPTEEELATWVTTRYGVLAEQAAADVRSFLSDLQEIGLIHGV